MLMKENGEFDITYPLISYLLHFGSLFDDRWVSARFSTIDELNEACERLGNNGTERKTLENTKTSSHVSPYDYYGRPSYAERQVNFCTCDAEEAKSTYGALCERGVNFSENRAAGFAYSDEEFTAYFVFSGQITEECYRVRAEKNFHELDFEEN